MKSDSKAGSVTFNKTRSEVMQSNLEAEKTRLNNRLKNQSSIRSLELEEVDDDGDCSTTLASSTRLSLSSTIRSSVNSNLSREGRFDGDNSIYSIHSVFSCETSSSSKPRSSSGRRAAKKKVRFYPFHANYTIEPHHNMSSKEKRNYWWERFELAEMRPTYRRLKRLHQNCGKKDCIRGLEVQYWTMKMMKEADFRPDNNSLLEFANEFLPPPQPSPDMEPDCKEVIDYQEYLKKSQRRARIFAHIDEVFVMEHVYGRPGSHLDLLQDDRWDYLHCCSCHSSSSGQESSYFGRVMKGVRRSLRGKEGKELLGKQCKLPAVDQINS